MGGETGVKINSADIFDFEKLAESRTIFEFIHPRVLKSFCVWLYEWKYLGTNKCMKFQQQKN